MKFLKFAFIFLGITFLISCGGDDDECAQENWVGMYSGTESCAGDVVDATMDVTSSGEGVIMTITSNGTTVELVEAALDGCNSSISVDSFSANGSLNGDEIVLNTSFFGSACVYTVTRQ